MRRAVALATLTLATVPFTVAAQWQGYPTPRIPRTADGKVNLSAPAPKTADGQPDLNGIWLASRAVFDLRQAVKDIPLSPEGKAIFDQRQATQSKDDPSGRCLLVGVPRITSMPLPIKIIQTKDEVTFLYETFHAFRVIPTDGRKHPDDLDPSFMGDSVGHWEGDTLVVDVVGFNDKTWLGAGGASLHSDALHVVERYQRVDYDTITYNVFIEDPKVFTKTWNTAPSFLSLRPGERLREYECIADNQDIQRFEELLKNPALFVRPQQ